MGTSAAIGIQNEDGSVDYITTPIGGADILDTLQEHYNTERKVRALLALGYEIVLGDSLGSTEVLSSREQARHVDDGAVFRRGNARQFTNGEYSYLFRPVEATWYWRKHGSRQWLRKPAAEVPEAERVVMSTKDFGRLHAKKPSIGARKSTKQATPGTPCHHCKAPIIGEAVSFHYTDGKTSKHYHPAHSKHHKG